MQIGFKINKNDNVLKSCQKDFSINLKNNNQCLQQIVRKVK